MNWNIREITDGKLHPNNMTREDCLNLKKPWKPLTQKRHKKYTSTYSALCALDLKNAFLIHLPLAQGGSLSHSDNNLQCFLWPDSFNDFKPLGSVLFFYYYLTLLLKHYGCKDISTSNK